MIPSLANIRKAIYCLNKRLDLLEGGEYSNTVTELSNKVHALESLLDEDLLNSTSAIDKFNEIVAFLNTIENTDTVSGLLGDIANELALGAVYDVSAKNPTAGANNDGKWESLSALLSDSNLSTLIPTSVRKGGMSIKFVQSSDNKYVQYRLKSNVFSTIVNEWQEADNWPNNVAYFSNDNGEGVIPSDGIRAVTITSAATMTINPDVVTVIDGAVGTATITLQVPQDNLAHVWDILLTTDSSVAITFAMSNSATILYPSGFSIGASKAVEISVIGVGTKYYLRYGEFA